VLVVSEDLDEVRALADRIAVMHAGRLTEARPAEDWTLGELGLAMAGASRSEGAERSGSTERSAGARDAA
jgi:simple sugar transport system ATP-binding protein